MQVLNAQKFQLSVALFQFIAEMIRDPNVTSEQRAEAVADVKQLVEGAAALCAKFCLDPEIPHHLGEIVIDPKISLSRLDEVAAPLIERANPAHGKPVH